MVRGLDQQAGEGSGEGLPRGEAEIAAASKLQWGAQSPGKQELNR